MSTLATVLLLAFCIGVILAFVASVIYVRRQRARELQTLNELIENKRFYLALIDNNLDTLAVVDPEGHFRFVNKSLVDLLGFSIEQISTMDFRVHIHPDDRPQFDREWATLLKGKDPVSFTPFRYYDAWGNYHWKRCVVRNMLDDPDIQGLILSSSDITELINTMETLRLTEQRIRVTLTAANIALVTLDLNGVITWVFNPLFGERPEDLVGRSDWDVLLPPETAKRFTTMRKHIIAEGGHLSDELEYVYQDIHHIVSIHMERLLNPQGQVTGIVCAVSDVTRLRAITEQTQLSQRMEAIGQLTGGIAHDFNNLLAVIVGNLELLQDHLAKDPQLGHFVELALKAADRGAGLTRSLLAFARKQSLEIEPVDPNRLLAEISELLRRSLPPSIQLVLQAEPQVWLCRADAGQLQNAVINLVVNARDAMPNGGTVTISTSNIQLDHRSDTTLPPDVPPGDYVLICVADTGTGMPPEVLEHVFEPFFTTKPHGKGSGLGLSIVYGFAKQLGGHLAIDTKLNEGTRVCLYIPRLTAELEQPVPELAAAPASVSGATILVVDDDEDIRHLTSTLLKRAGYTTREADTGQAALALLEEDSAVDLLLTDMLLGTGPNGLDLIDRVRQLHPGLPVVLMSGFIDTSTGDNQDREITVPRLRKPFRRHELEATIKEALTADRPSAAPAALVVPGSGSNGEGRDKNSAAGHGAFSGNSDASNDVRNARSSAGPRKL